MFLIQWIVSSCALILAVLLLRAALGGRISARLRYALWAAVLLRLLIPAPLFSVTVPASSDTGPVQSSSAPAQTSAIAEPERGGFAGTVTEEAAAPTEPAQPAPSPARILAALWLTGSVCTALVLLGSNLRFARRIRRTRQPVDLACTPAVYTVGNLPSPCLFGLVRPAIYLTPETAVTPVRLRHVLAHERTHYRHGDHIWSALRALALAVHWWNPLVWAAVWLSRRDGELACDEGTLRRLGDGERTAYGETLLALVTAPPRPGDLLSCATTMNSGKHGLHERIRRIARTPRQLLWAAAAAIVLTALTACCAFTGAAQPEQTAGPVPDRSVTCDLDRNGISEQILLHTGEGLYTLRVEEPAGSGADTAASKLLWSTEAADAHQGWKAVFLTQAGDGDCLMEYTPTMYCGEATYAYRIFYLDGDGGEIVMDEDSVSFGINFMFDDNSFDARALAAFIEQVNAWLAQSTLLLNTDTNLASTFQRLGMLQDDLWFLEGDGFTRDPDKSLLENLLAYQNTMTAQAAVPTAVELLAGIQAADLSDTGGADAAALAQALNGAAYAPETDAETWSPAFRLTVHYTLEDSSSPQTAVLEAPAEGDTVLLSLTGQVTYLFHSENPDNESIYLSQTPYSLTLCVEDTDLCQLVRTWGHMT